MITIVVMTMITMLVMVCCFCLFKLTRTTLFLFSFVGAYDLVVRLSSSSSPLLRALPGYERQLLTNLKRGEFFVAFSEQIVASCKKSLAAQQVQMDALRAAISNLQDHFASLKTTFVGAQEKLSAQQARHRGLLDAFESHLSALATVPLHPSLVEAVGGREGLAAMVQAGTGSASSATAGLQSSVSNHNYRPQDYQLQSKDREQQQLSSTATGEYSEAATLLGNTTSLLPSHLPVSSSFNYGHAALI